MSGQLTRPAPLARAEARRWLVRSFLAAGLLAALPLLGLWATGGLGDLARWAAAGQRDAQNAMAGALRGLRAGHDGAFWGLIGLGFAYGVFHAVGPGHGKVLIGGFGMARRVPFVRLAGLAVASSLAQATTAVVLVYAGVGLLDWTREHVVGLAEGAMVTVSHLMVAAIGLWLAWRGGRRLWRDSGLQTAQRADHGHHDHHHDDMCGCGHAHGPTVEQAEAVTTWREGAALIAGIAIRPCTGALFLLVLTWQMGLGLAGIAGTYAMGLGTALVTVAVAGLSAWSREGVLATLAGGRLSRALPLIELAAGLAIAALALLLVRATV